MTGNRLTGKPVITTGATGGTGRGIARHIASERADVLVADSNESTAAEICTLRLNTAVKFSGNCIALR
jgi:NAD(P)-dependent dehydrogenase (short-subunit alcohol dehydrogenase family)